MTQRYVIAGCGYTGRRLGRRLSQDSEVLCVSRSSKHTRHLRAAGLTAITDDLGAPRNVAETAGAVIIYLAPPPTSGDQDTTITAYLANIEHPSRFVYVSTSGVYGDCAGEIVNEYRPAAPATARAQRRLAAENALRLWGEQNDVETVVLRVAGIYGPDRLPVDRIRRREPVLRVEDAGPGNRIHVDDLVTACELAATVVAPPTPINVCDGNHISSTQFINLVAKICSLPEPPTIKLEDARREFSPIRWSFLSESRRLDNTRMLDELGVELRYSDPAEGIRASLSVS
ncbi:MAG: NAD-dependent epimerase/dehydratase family protein [Gammaproteobacteria bacterium]|nr:NAD-dependent epimerase/dehydratase family protein [Gammaproteobacteria bacterium]MDH3767543.1 NAD-dependent epimerase/dehydratase family protein [Gammaproteobacteria bacterium]